MHPKFIARRVTVRFVTSGRVTAHLRQGGSVGMPRLATLVGFDDLQSVEASEDLGAVSATIAVDILARAYGTLTGDPTRPLPRLASVAEIASDGMRALYFTIEQIHRRVETGRRGDAQTLPLLREIMGYQLLSAWPRTEVRAAARPSLAGTAANRDDLLVRARRLIERELHRADLTPVRLAARLGVSVRKLHLVFEPSGVSVSRHLLARRLAHAERLLCEAPHLSVTEVAYATGFESLSTFFRCYRTASGTSPGQRRAALERDGCDREADRDGNRRRTSSSSTMR